MAYGVTLYSPLTFRALKCHFSEKKVLQLLKLTVTFDKKLQKAVTDTIVQAYVGGISGKNLIFECNAIIELSLSLTPETSGFETTTETIQGALPSPPDSSKS